MNADNPIQDPESNSEQKPKPGTIHVLMSREPIDLDTFLRRSWGRCAAFDQTLNLAVSRVCPLAREIYEFRRESRGVPLDFACGNYRDRTCPILAEVLDAALDEQENGTRRRYLGDEFEDIIGPWYDEIKDDRDGIKWLNRAVDEVVDAVNNNRNQGTEIETGRWSDNQCALFCRFRRIYSDIRW